MANVNIELGYKPLVWFTANPTIVLLAGQIVYLEQTGTYKIGDGVSTLSALSFLGVSSEIQTLQNVTDLGNTTTNDIQFDAGVGILLDNTSRLREGTIDAGYGGNKGIAQICAVGYELKWESGSLYVMDGNGTHIRHTLYNFSSVPSITEDINKGFLVGTRWSLDNGNVYVCTDNSIGAAVWVLEASDFTDAEKTKLSGIASGAEVNVNADWNAISGDAEILNKPTIPTVTPSALTKTDDTNVTLTLGGSPSTALLAATSITVGWTGTLADSRIASASTWNAKQAALSGTGFVKSTAGVISYDTNTYLTTTSAASTYVPYTGATGNVDLGTHSLIASDLIINHASGSGVAASIIKGGNGEALTVVKSSGSGNVASITGGNTFISTLTTPTINGVSGNLAFANAVQTSGAITAFTFTKPNNTTQTASTQINGFVVNGGTRQWATGNITTQSENVWGATTYSFVGASTITNAYGNVFNAPIAGTNATITNNWSAQFNGNVVIGSTGQLIEIKQTATAPTFVQTGSASSEFRLNSGTRSLRFTSYSIDSNYFLSTGAAFRIYTTDTQPIQLYTNNLQRFVVLSTGGILLKDANDLNFESTTGSKIATATTQKIAFWNATPIVQPTTSVTASTFVSNTSAILNDTATFDGYTIGQVVKALRNMGLLA